MQFDEHGHLVHYEPILTDLETFEQEFVAAVHPPGHRLEVLIRHDRAEWLFNFTRTTSRRTLPRRYKGFIEISY